MKKKLLIVGILFTVVLFSVNAQGFYFDIGASFGVAINANLWATLEPWEEISSTSTSFGFSFKAGYGPNENLPLYFVGTVNTEYAWFYGSSEYSRVGNEYIMSYNDFSFETVPVFIGLGIIYYPVRFLQIASSFGLLTGHFRRYDDNGVDISGEGFSFGSGKNTVYSIERGFAYDLSIAFDLGKNSHGCLLGVKFQHSIGSLASEGFTGHHLNLGVFVKYAYRDKSSINQ